MADGGDRPGEVIELRVHGVSGTGPAALLDCPPDDVLRVAGDDRAGFYRRVADAPPVRARGEWRRIMEAYSWGGLTSGRASRAVWLLVLPFVLVDLAPWMLPAPARRRWFASIAVGLLRLLALSFTATLLLAAATAVLDVLVWQCAGVDRCADRAGPLIFFHDWDRGPQLAVGALPLVAMIAVLWGLGREDLRYPGSPTPPDPAVLRDEVPLAAPTFWQGDDSIVRLRACHVTAWAAGLAAVILAAPTRYAVGTARLGGLGLLLINGLILVAVVAAIGWNRSTGRGGVGADRTTRPLRLLRWVALAVLAASLIWTTLVPADYPAAPTHLPGLRGAIYLLLAVQVGLLVALVGAIARAKRGAAPATEPAGYRPTLGGYTAWYVALLAWLIGGAFSVGVGLSVADLLGDVVVSTDQARAVLAEPGAAAPMIVPPPYLWAAVAIVGVLTIALIAVMVLRRVGRWRAGRAIPQVHDDYPEASADDPRLARIAQARATASLADTATTVVAGLALLTVAVIIVMAWWYRSDSGGFEALPSRAATITTVCVRITILLIAALIVLVAVAYRDRQVRRSVAVLWDVVTFWPRTNHPLTPPSYGEWAVPELHARLGALAVDPRQRVVLAAHSQGSVIAAAALLRHRPDPQRIGLLSFGSPLRRLYARNFPGYFGSTALHQLRTEQPARWINLWALSDPIGSWVFTSDGPAVDRRLLDALNLADVPGGICGHSGYWSRPEYAESITTLQDEVVPAGVVTDDSAVAPPVADLL